VNQSTIIVGKKKFKSLAETSWDKEEYFNEENIIKKIELNLRTEWVLQMMF